MKSDALISGECSCEAASEASLELQEKSKSRKARVGVPKCRLGSSHHRSLGF